MVRLNFDDRFCKGPQNTRKVSQKAQKITGAFYVADLESLRNNNLKCPRGFVRLYQTISNKFVFK